MSKYIQSTEFEGNLVEIPIQHPGQANLVKVGLWRGQPVAIKTARPQDGALNEFYTGIADLFGASIQMPYHYVNMYRVLSVHSTLLVPHLYTIFPLDAGKYQPTHTYVEGRAALSFAELTHDGVEQFGKHMAALHAAKVNGAGCFGALVGPEAFRHQMYRSIDKLSQIPTCDDETRQYAQEVLQEWDTFPTATHFAPIMLDLDPTQYFIARGKFTHLIDIDFVVFGPPELELIALESMLPRHLADDFVRGYQRVRNFPPLAQVRPTYRLLNRLLCVQGRQPASEWTTREVLFP
ncbi:hypothetical protein [Alicyclobacillus fastidiosus]|uniref:Aminoglycoside phosphotransferase domain-containing protein n=1 Tax=Alicyclobacillus fastidiosus TaxID=392011 RepID=A0ABV5AFJ1_9BACL|nr:hypothetical protein [Alicyclobacillus fastidiosus]WEH09658.1 hypothetical protein PYS47_23980 [Alicyclobacillus fastidiosus]